MRKLFWVLLVVGCSSTTVEPVANEFDCEWRTEEVAVVWGSATQARDQARVIHFGQHGWLCSVSALKVNGVPKGSLWTCEVCGLGIVY